MTKQSIAEVLPTVERKGELIAIARYPHPDDSPYFRALFDVGHDEYEVWTYNAEARSFASQTEFKGAIATIAPNRINAMRYFHYRLEILTTDYQERLRRALGARQCP